MKSLVKISLAIFAAAVVGWLAFGFFGVQALFLDREVNEEIPQSVSQLISGPATDSNDSPGNGAGPELVGKGAFQQGDSTYTISGDAFLSRIEGQLTLTFRDFEVSNGPDLFVYAVKTASTDNKTVKDTVANEDFVNLGALKGNIGNQSYPLEADLNPEEYQVIAIWCRRFSRNFGSVSLAASPDA